VRKHRGQLILRSCAYTAVLLGLGVGCSSRIDAPMPGHYRAVLQLPGGEAPFGLEVATENERFVLYLLNSSERSRVSDVRVADGEILASFPGYENSLRARTTRTGMDGAVTLIKAGGKEQVIPFSATLAETHRFYKHARSDNADLAGRWEATLTNPREITVISKDRYAGMSCSFPRSRAASRTSTG
jgi:hypothetical protein